jgi:hypothetical protein
MDPDVIEIPPPPTPIVSRCSSTKQPKNKQVLFLKVAVFIQFRALLFSIYFDHEFILLSFIDSFFFLGIYCLCDCQTWCLFVVFFE